MPTLRVRYRDPAHDFGELAIVPRPQKQMPVVRHQTVRRNPDARPLVSFVKNFFKGKIVAGLVEQPQATDTAV